MFWVQLLFRMSITSPPSPRHFPSQNSKQTSENLWMSTCHDKGSEGSGRFPCPGGPCHANVIASVLHQTGDVNMLSISWDCDLLGLMQPIGIANIDNNLCKGPSRRGPWHVEAVRSNIAKN